METFLKLKEKGKIRAIGVSNASMEDLKEYVKYGVLDTDQEKYSIIDTEVEAEILPWCHERNVSMLAYSPVSKGLLTGKMDPLRSFSSDDSRTGDPRFSSKNIERANMLLEKHLKGITEKYSISYGHIASAWITKDPKNIALCGARNKAQAIENALSGDLVLDDDDLRKIQQFKNEYEENIR